MQSMFSAFVLMLLTQLALPAIAHADDYVLVIRNHRFSPQELVVPAGERVKITIHNQDDTAEEFESKDLRREKIIAGNSSANIWVGPLPAGEYGFIGEFNEDSARGKLVAK